MAPPNTNTSPPEDRDERLHRLRAQLVRWAPRKAGLPVSGAPLWRDLVGRVGPKRLVDLIAGTPGSAAGLVALWLGIEACRERGELVVIDHEGSFFPPSAIGWGVDAKRLLYVRAGSTLDALASAETALRSPAVGAVWASLGSVDGRQFRRLLLATEAGEAFGVLVRPTRHLDQPSWADVQLRIDPQPGNERSRDPLLVRATQTRNRHGPVSGQATLAIDWDTGALEERRATNDAARPATNLGDLAPGLGRSTRPA